MYIVINFLSVQCKNELVNINKCLVALVSNPVCIYSLQPQLCDYKYTKCIPPVLQDIYIQTTLYMYPLYTCLYTV